MEDFDNPNKFFESPGGWTPEYLPPSLPACNQPEVPSLTPLLDPSPLHAPSPAATVEEDIDTFFRFEDFPEEKTLLHVESALLRAQAARQFSWMGTREDVWERALTLGEVPWGKQIPNLPPFPLTPGEEPTAPGVQHGPIYDANDSCGFVPDPDVWDPFYSAHCKYCLTFRCIVHANGLYRTKLSLHVSSNVLQHAILVVQYLTHEMKEKVYIADLKSRDHKSVEKFILDYANSRVQHGLKIIEDNYLPFLDLVTAKMDYFNKYTNSSMLIEFEDKPQVPEASSDQERQKLNKSDISSLETRRLGKVSKKKRTISGVESTEGCSEEDQMHSQGLQNFDRKTQMQRTISMSYDDLSKYFHLPLVEACQELQICSTALKRVCRRHNIKRWPYRKVLTRVKKILKRTESLKYQRKSNVSKTLKRLQLDSRELEEIYSPPAIDKAKED